MAWIQTVDEADATGIVKEEYDAALERRVNFTNRQTSQRPTEKYAPFH